MHMLFLYIYNLLLSILVCVNVAQKCFQNMWVKCAPSLCPSQESDGEKSDDNLVVDVSNEVQHSLAAWRLLCYLIRKKQSISSLSVLTHHRIPCLLEEVLPTRLGRTDWTSVARRRRMPRWVLPPSPPPAAHLHPNPKRLIWWVIWVIIAFWSSFSSLLWVVFYFRHS